MFSYYLKLAKISLLKNPVLSLLMISAIGLGIGASMTTLTLNHLMSANPIAHKNDVLFHVQLDSWGANQAFRAPNTPPDQVTHMDATNLVKAQRAFRQTAIGTTNLIVQPQGEEAKPFMTNLRLNHADFFSMFDVPFLYGSGWQKSSDDSRELVVVLSKETNMKVFGGENSVGRSLEIGKNTYQIVGVMDEWTLKPKFFDLTNGPFAPMEDAYIPFSLKEAYELPGSGTVNCWKRPDGGSFKAQLNSECVNYQLWVELQNSSEVTEYNQFLDSYVNQQKAMGRFPRPLNNRLLNVMQWLEDQQVVSDDVQMLMWMAFMFLLVCIFNTSGLLLAKFSGKGGEIGLRRAIGATKLQLYIQHIIESALVGFIGGALGLILAWLGLQEVRSMYGENMNQVTHLDLSMVIIAIMLAIVSSILAGLYPTWRASNISPSSQLKID